MTRIAGYSLIAAALCCLTCAGCSKSPEPLTYRVLNVYPHDPQAYTQGLLVHDGVLYESTGLYGQSTVRRVDLASGDVLAKLDFPSDVFGEGLAYHDRKLFGLTWRKGTAVEIDPESFSVVRTHKYEGEGWGLTGDGTYLIMSDGTSTLRFINPAVFSVVKTLRVTEDGQPVQNLNELEFVDGTIYANVYLTDRVVAIDPASGRVTAMLDFSGLRGLLPSPNRAEVLNGIAHDAQTGNFLVTGKRWPLLFELEWAK